MLRSPPWLAALAVASCNADEAPPASLDTYGATELAVVRGLDVTGTPSVFVMLGRPAETKNQGTLFRQEGCPALDDETSADLAGIGMALFPGGTSQRAGGWYCDDAMFRAAIAPLGQHDGGVRVNVSGQGKELHVSVVDLVAAPTALAAREGTSVTMRVADTRGSFADATALWNGASATVHIDGARVAVDPPEGASGAVLVDISWMFTFQTEGCEGIDKCTATWISRDRFAFE